MIEELIIRKTISKKIHESTGRRSDYWIKTLEKVITMNDELKALRRRAGEVACELTGADFYEMFRPCRKREVLYARQFVIAYMAKGDMYGIYSLNAIFGKDHSTNGNIKYQHEALYEKDMVYKMYYDEFVSRMSGEAPKTLKYKIDGSLTNNYSKETEEIVFNTWVSLDFSTLGELADYLGISTREARKYLKVRVGAVNQRSIKKYRRQYEQGGVSEVG